jgi:NADH:ubiquinone oxidoreductase subunit F (NADH-binding)
MTMSADQLPRLLSGTPGVPRSYQEHHDAFAVAERRPSLMGELEASGLIGRGGAGFPTARKAQLLRAQHGRHKVVVVNAMEGEPASHKDAALLATNPHLVLDGAEILAAIISARRVIVAIARNNTASIAHVTRAIRERERHDRRGPTLEIQTPPWRYVAGEESALVHWLNERQSLPQYRPHRPSVLEIGGHATLVENAETCANVALIGRFGATWYREVGTAASPGSTLVSVTGAVERPTVIEVALGTPLRTVLALANADPEPQALLLGGYGGSWIPGDDLEVVYENESLARLGASVGAGVLGVLGRSGCGVVETERVVKWMANESARQCGPCAFGLPALGADLAELSAGGRDAKLALERLRERCGVIVGRGACRHPDGVVRLVRSCLDVFHQDLADHARGDVCAQALSGRRFLSVPRLEREDELVWG